MKKQSHVIMGNNSFVCDNCGQEYKLQMPMSIEMFNVMAKQFEKEHKYCKDTKPKLDPADQIEKRMLWWRVYGHRGTSSMTIYSVISGDNIMSGTNYSHPHDLDDFNRCYELLQAIPEWKTSLFRLKDLSPAWCRLVDNWDWLTALLEEKLKGGKNDLYEQMQILIK